MSDNFKQDVKIDPLALDDANIIQAELYAEWGERWASAVKERDYLKEQKDMVKAELDEKIRSRPEKYGWEGSKSPTEAFISSQILLQQEYIAVSNSLIEAQYNVNMMGLAKEAIENKGKSIDRELEMYRLGYKVISMQEKPSRKEDVAKKNTQEQNEGLKRNRRLRKEDD